MIHFLFFPLVNVNKAMEITRTYVNRFAKGQLDKGDNFDNARQPTEARKRGRGGQRGITGKCFVISFSCGQL